MTRRASDRRGDALRLADIEEATILLEDIERRGLGAFSTDPHLQAAATRYLEVIGEAAGKLSEAFRADHPDVPIRRMRGFASMAKHEYWRIDVRRLWGNVQMMPEIRRLLTAARID